MSYKKLIGVANPGFILILVDQSASMNDAFNTGEAKKDVAAKAVNRVIDAIGMACQSGNNVKDRCFISVIGYGARIDLQVFGMISQLADNPKRIDRVKKKESDGAGGLVELDIQMPIWLEPKADNGTPMAEAFELAYKTIEDWIERYPDNFPPVVINITDGEPNDQSATFTAAKKVMEQKTSDGNVLVLNAHISDASAGEICLPNTDGMFNNPYAKFLFSISSMLPDTLISAAEKAGFSPQTHSRGFVFNAGPESMIKLLNFGSLGSIGALR
ncbi:MAG: VWA domain-containing protein [Thiotrichaceae bacterium]|nr:VWA domain-containing protein [Thiotrichaceae bacterium]